MIVALAAVAAHGLPGGFVKKQIGSLDVAMLKCAPDGRVFVTEKNGKIRVVKDDVLLPTPFVNIQSRTNNGEERGMLGVAVDPAYGTNHFVYAWWVSKTGPAFITRWTADGDLAAAGSEKEIFSMGSHGGTYHHGGYVGFGPEGKIFATRGNRQDPGESGKENTVFAKVLRINADGSIPDDNPWASSNTGNARAAWAWGVRNSFNVRFHPKTGRGVFGDVQDGASSDELNILTKGAGYGYGGGGNTGSFYRTGCCSAIMGGVFYAGDRLQFPQEYRDKYFFGNSGGGALRYIDVDSKQAQVFDNMGDCPIDVDIDRDGALWTTNRCGTGSTSNGKIYKITYPGGVTFLPPLDPGRITRALRWTVAQEAVRLELVEAGMQSVEMRAVDGRVLASAAANGPATILLPAPMARGLHLLVWKKGDETATGKLLLP